MNKRFIIYLIVFIASICIIIYRYIRGDGAHKFLQETLLSISIGTMTTSLIGLMEFYLSNEKHFWNSLVCKIFKKNKKVYVSLSYLIQIKISGEEKYFLVRGKKHAYQYQPVGGVYKIAKNFDIEKKWKVEFKEDKNNKDDLRFFVKAWFIPDIIKWFKSCKNREIGVWREFNEEVLETNLLDEENFKNINIEYLDTKEKLMVKENRFSNEEYHTILYDIFKINLTDKQEQELKNLISKDICTEDYAFVSLDEIMKERNLNNEKVKIGEHTKHIINSF